MTIEHCSWCKGSGFIYESPAVIFKCDYCEGSGEAEYESDDEIPSEH